MKVLKNGRSELFHMNGEALKNLIAAAGYSCKSLSEKMEFNGNYLSKCIRQNKIGQVAVQKLMEYNIRPAMYQVENFDILKKKNSGRYPLGESEKSPAEEAIEEPGVVKLEFTIDIVKLKAIVKAAVKEAYDEI